ncbi:hypothetical protein AVEN_84260-1 [Araneus ventricosus]|uniref:Uncharacterized protein n=1 Tax=Araneus ventricosus TaxID=182803 RepID=A0A4Y2J3C6_ARAVE|nr:hypothetical protein AVEN_84260-1 [Araneus ventricosus]
MQFIFATLKHHALNFKEEFPKVYEFVEKCLCVGDLISETEAMETHQNMKTVMQKASFNIRKWTTRLGYLQQKWKEEGHLDSISSVSSSGKVLAMHLGEQQGHNETLDT